MSRFGLLYRAEHRAALFAHRAQVDVLEIVAEHFLDLTAEQRDELDVLRAHFDLTVHALGTSIGSSDGVDGRYLARIAALVDYVRPLWWSDHLALTRACGVELGAFAPLPRTEETVAIVARNVAAVRDAVPGRFALENPATAFVLPADTLDAAAYLADIATAADCELILDLENLHADAWNVGTDAGAVVAGIPAERVCEVHLAGGRRTGDGYVDAHDGPVPDRTWALYRAFCRRSVPPLTLLEREAALPPLAHLLDELDAARAAAA